MAVKKKTLPIIPTVAISIKISRADGNQKQMADEIDRLATIPGETVQSIGLKAIVLGLPKLKTYLTQFKENGK